MIDDDYSDTDYRCTGCGVELENPGRLSVCYTCQHDPVIPTTVFKWAENDGFWQPGDA